MEGERRAALDVDQDPAARILGCYSEPNWQTTIRSLYKLLGSSELPPGRLISSVQVIGGTEPQPIALVEAWTMATQLQRGGLAISSLSPRKLRSQALAIPKVGRTHQIQAGPLFRQQSHNRQLLSCPHSATRSRHSSCLIAKAWIGHCRLGQEHLRATGHPVLGDVRHADMPETLGTICPVSTQPDPSQPIVDGRGAHMATSQSSQLFCSLSDVIQFSQQFDELQDHSTHATLRPVFAVFAW